MNIQPISPNFTGGSIVYRVSKEYSGNITRPFFENEILKIVRDQNLPANIHKKHFDITFDTQFEQAKIQQFKDKLDKAGIKFKLLI